MKILFITQRYLNKTWYPFLVAALNAADLFLLVVPNDILLVSAVFAQPRRWFSIAVINSVGCTLGAAVLYALLNWDPEAIKAFFPQVFNSHLWADTEIFVKHWAFGHYFWGPSDPCLCHPLSWSVLCLESAPPLCCWGFLSAVF